MWITVIETLVLSVLGIVLSFVELFMLKEYLRYTEQRKSKNALETDDSAYDDDKDLDKKFNQQDMTDRRLLMSNILRNFRRFKDKDLNNKLDELL